ncbi:hypothetical protein PENTCL1PPCAC_4025, partial [Pristionchus entomophagus]
IEEKSSIFEISFDTKTFYSREFILANYYYSHDYANVDDLDIEELTEGTLFNTLRYSGSINERVCAFFDKHTNRQFSFLIYGSFPNSSFLLSFIRRASFYTFMKYETGINDDLLIEMMKRGHRMFGVPVDLQSPYTLLIIV